MAITTLAQLRAARRQICTFQYTANRSVGSAVWSSYIGIAANFATGTLAGSSTTTGVVPTSSTAGFPSIESFNSQEGYISNITYNSTIAGKLRLFDLLWKGGAYAFNASTSGNTPTSYASRVPGGDYKGLEIWLEQVTAGTGNQNVNVTYINQDGTSGRSTGTQATAVNGVARMWRLPLQAGDTGVQGVTGVVGSTATAGTFNILVMRPLWSGRTELALGETTEGIDKVMFPRIYDTSALFLAVSVDSAASPIPFADIEVVSG